MGSIVYINKDPNKWSIIDNGLILNEENEFEPVIKIGYGTFDDDPCCTVDLYMYMRKSIYNLLLSGDYHVDKKSLRVLKINDKKGEYIHPLVDEMIY